MKYSHFNFQPFKDQILITNDLGRFAFLNRDDLFTLIKNPDSLHEEIRQTLENAGFLYSGSSLAWLQKHSEAYAGEKNYLFGSTALHIFVVTSSCNVNCVYCQAGSAGNHAQGKMDQKTAIEAARFALSSPRRHLTFEFQGGEPLLNFEAIRTIVEWTEEHKQEREIEYTIVTNLTLLKEEHIAFFQKYHFSVSTSLDGPKHVHDANRPMSSGSGTWKKTILGVNRLRKAGIPVGAIETTTRFSLKHGKEIIQAYLDAGFSSVFIRPLTPLGFASDHWDSIGYTPQEFLAFYQECIKAIIEKNNNGIFMQEIFAATLLSRILHGKSVNYMELRSPCGAALGQLAYYTDGSIYTCDEGRMLAQMGDPSFRLGHVASDTYQKLIQKPACRAVCLASITESIPSCCDCVYQPYCGVCPVVNLALEKDLIPKTPNGYRCQIQKGILDFLFGLLYENDPKTIGILQQWQV